MKVIDAGQEVLKSQGAVFKYAARRMGRRVACFLVAIIFMLFAFVSAHAVLWVFAMSVLHFTAFVAASSILGLDVLCAIIFLLLGLRNDANPSEFEARLRRDRKMTELRQSLAISSFVGLLLGPVGRFTGRQAMGGLRNVFTRR